MFGDEDFSGLADDLDDDDKAALGMTTEEPVVVEEDVVTPEGDADAIVADDAAAEAAAAEAAAAEAAAAGGEDDEDEEKFEGNLGGNKGQFVRLGALHRERKLRKQEKDARIAAEAKIAEQSERNARVDERLRLLTQAAEREVATQQQVQQQEQQPQKPNKEDDPFAYMDWLEQQIVQLNATTESVNHRFEADDEYKSVQTAFMADAQHYTKSNPDFLNAYQHLRAARDRQLELLGRSNPHERAEIFRKEELEIVRECLRQRKSPSELVYQLAQNLGYAKPAAPAAPAAAAPAAAAPAAAAVKPTALQVVEGIKKGQTASKSLGAVAGGGGKTVTAESLADMDEDEFMALYAKMSSKQKRELLGA